MKPSPPPVTTTKAKPNRYGSIEAYVSAYLRQHLPATEDPRDVTSTPEEDQRG